VKVRGTFTLFHIQKASNVTENVTTPEVVTVPRFFASRITYTAKDWKDAESYYECFAMLTA
jgi:hypothetical protein